jgi:hypothetical protein
MAELNRMGEEFSMTEVAKDAAPKSGAGAREQNGHALVANASVPVAVL